MGILFFLPLASAANLLPSPLKPPLSDFLKPKTIELLLDKKEAVVHAQWHENGDFSFLNAVLVSVPMSFARPKTLEFSLYPRLSSAIKKFHYDPETKTIEAIGEAGGLRMHSWVQVKERYWDETHYEIVKGDMIGFKIQVYFWEKNGKTIILGKGLLPDGKKRYASGITLLFKPVAEIVLSVATKKFQSYIEEEYKKNMRK